MPEETPIEYSGKVLDKRNTLTGPDDDGKATYPEKPQNIPIQQKNSQKDF